MVLLSSKSRSTLEQVPHIPPPKPGLNPFDLLPVELISEIFLLRHRDYLLSREKSDEIIDNELRPPNIVLSEVCRRFRSTALTTPLLWNIIEIYHIPIRRNTTKWINLCLERSASCPLDFEFEFSIDDDPKDRGPFEIEIDEGILVTDTGSITRLMKMLQRHCSRWRSFWVSFEGTSLTQYFFAFFSEDGEPLPMLERLVTYQNEDYEEEDLALGTFKPTHIPSHIVPNVKCFHNWSIPLRWDLPFPFRNLKELDLSYFPDSMSPDISQLYDALAASLDLVELELRAPRPFYHFPPIDQQHPSVQLHSLKKLRISQPTDAYELVRLMRLIRAPNLQTLILQQLLDADFGFAIRQMGEERSDCGYPSVTQLRLDGLEIAREDQAEEAYRALFMSMPLITHLSVDGSQTSNTRSPFRAMRHILDDAHTPSNNIKSMKDLKVVLPNLSTLQVDDVNMTELCETLVWRKGLGRQVETLLLRAGSQPEGVEETAFEILDAELVGTLEWYEPSESEYDSDDFSDSSVDSWETTEGAENEDDSDNEEHIVGSAASQHNNDLGLESDSSESADEISAWP